MEIKELKKHIPNLSEIILKTCKISMSSFGELADADKIDKQLLIWGTYPKIQKIEKHVVFYKHPFMGPVIYDKLTDTIFIKKNSLTAYKLWKKSQMMKFKINS